MTGVAESFRYNSGVARFIPVLRPMVVSNNVGAPKPAMLIRPELFVSNQRSKGDSKKTNNRPPARVLEKRSSNRKMACFIAGLVSFYDLSLGWGNQAAMSAG